MQLAAVTQKLEEIRAAGGVKAADPQLESLSAVTGWNVTKFEAAMLMLVAVMIEFISTFGLYFALGHGRKSAPDTSLDRATTAMSQHVAARRNQVVDVVANDKEHAETLPIPVIDPAEVVARYGVARLEQHKGSAIDVKALHDDYTQWCQAQGEAPSDLDEFTWSLQKIARQVKTIEVVEQDGKTMLLHMQFSNRLAA